MVCFSCRPILFSSYLSSTSGFQGYSYVSANAAAPRHHAPTCRISPPQNPCKWCDVLEDILMRSHKYESNGWFEHVCVYLSCIFRALQAASWHTWALNILRSAIPGSHPRILLGHQSHPELVHLYRIPSPSIKVPRKRRISNPSETLKLSPWSASFLEEPS